MRRPSTVVVEIQLGIDAGIPSAVVVEHDEAIQLAIDAGIQLGIDAEIPSAVVVEHDEAIQLGIDAGIASPRP